MIYKNIITDFICILVNRIYRIIKWFRKDLANEKTITSQQDQQRLRERCSSQASENVWTNQVVREYQPETRSTSKSSILKRLIH